MSRLEKVKSKDKLIYSRTEETKEPVSFGKFYIFLMFLSSVGLIYLLFFSGLLDIKKIEVSGYEHGDTVVEMVKEETEKNIFTKNILLFQTGELREKLLGDPNIKKIYIKKSFPNTVKIGVEESRPALIWISAGDKMLVSDRGVIMGNAGDEKLIEIYDASNIKVGAGERVASPTFIKFINDINSGFEAATGTKLIKITLLDLIEDVHILSSGGWTVYLNASISAEAQLKNLTRVLAEASKSKKKLEYIDMRLDDKIFYK